MDNLYQLKYNKYKTKYLNTKKQIGGALINQIDFSTYMPNCVIPIEEFNFYAFIGRDNNSAITFANVKIDTNINPLNINSNSDIKRYSYGTDFEFTFEIISPNNKSTHETNYKIVLDEQQDYIIHFIYKQKTRVVLTSKYKIFFLLDLILINKNLDPDYKKFYLNNIPNRINFTGTYQFANLEFNLFFEKINQNPISNLDMTQNITINQIIKIRKNYSDLFENTFEPFNFEKFYDTDIKPLNICAQSNNLAKNFASSFLNVLYIKNAYIKILASNYPLILKKILYSILSNNKNIIDTNCSNEPDRKFLLKNILKKLNAQIQDQVKIAIIENGQEVFKNITELNEIYHTMFPQVNRNLKVTLDTGNANTTIIGRQFAQVLGLPQTKSFKKIISGVVSNCSSSATDKINVKLKFIGDNIDVEKIYNMETYISDSYSNNSLLIGNYSDSLADIFSSSYCISYENDLNKYSLEKIMTDNNFDEAISNITHLISWYRTQGYLRDDFVYRPSILLKNAISILNQIDSMKKYYSTEQNKIKFDRIYSLFRELKELHRVAIDNFGAGIREPFLQNMTELGIALDDNISQ